MDLQPSLKSFGRQASPTHLAQARHEVQRALHLDAQVGVATPGVGVGRDDGGEEDVGATLHMAALLICQHRGLALPGERHDERNVLRDVAGACVREVLQRQAEGVEVLEVGEGGLLLAAHGVDSPYKRRATAAPQPTSLRELGRLLELLAHRREVLRDASVHALPQVIRDALEAALHQGLGVLRRAGSKRRPP